MKLQAGQKRKLRHQFARLRQAYVEAAIEGLGEGEVALQKHLRAFAVSASDFLAWKTDDEPYPVPLFENAEQTGMVRLLEEVESLPDNRKRVGGACLRRPR